MQTITLDRVCFDLDGIDLMKLDLEGAEALALTGAMNTLSRTKAVIFESVLDGEAEATRGLKQRGFSVRDLSRKDRLAEPARGG